MKRLTTIIGTLLLSTVALAHPTGPGATAAKVAELSAHRIDRLVTLGKIDASFMKNAQTLQVAVVENQAPVFYKVRVSQTQPTQGNPLQLDISFDDDGKPLAYQVVAGGIAGPDQAWPDKDSVTLTENCLHYVLENNADAKVAPFDKGLTTFVLTKGTLNGQAVARGQVTSSLTKEKLNIYLKLDGTFISAEVVQ